MSKTPESRPPAPLPESRSNSLPYAASRLGANIELLDLAREIAEADAMVNTRVSAQLKVIADQIRHLQQEARHILEQTRHDQELHRAECNFKRLPGKHYHLYQKPAGQRYFSMLSPADWGNQPPHTYLGSYRLENDMSWTLLNSDNEPAQDNSRDIVEHLLKKNFD